MVTTPRGGNDGISAVPSYLEVGVGTDGTPDERRRIENVMNRPLEDKVEPAPMFDMTLEQIQQENNVARLKKWIRESCPGVETPSEMKADEAKQILMARIVVSQE